MQENVITLIALILIMEGIFPAFFPNKWRNFIYKIARERAEVIQRLGFSLITLGLVILWLQQ